MPLRPRILITACIVALLVTAAYSAAFAIPPAEEARVVALLDALGKCTDMQFIRNGSTYTATEAADHLRLKFNKTKNRLQSAEQFIDKVASSSYISGKPYGVRTAKGKEEPANAFLHALLQRVAP